MTVWKKVYGFKITTAFFFSRFASTLNEYEYSEGKIVRRPFERKIKYARDYKLKFAKYYKDYDVRIDELFSDSVEIWIDYYDIPVVKELCFVSDSIYQRHMFSETEN